MFIEKLCHIEGQSCLTNFIKTYRGDGGDRIRVSNENMLSQLYVPVLLD